MLIYIVRHGETNANVNGYLQGWTDDPLNDNGILLAEITGRQMKDIKFDYCFSSPLKRAKETAEIIIRESGNNTLITIDNRSIEIDMGSWERKKYRPGEREVDKKAIQQFFSNPFHFEGFPQGETIFQVCARTQSFLKELISRDDDNIYLVSTHGVALRAMLNYLYEDKKDFWHGHVPYNCSVSVIEAKGGKGRIVIDDKVYYELDQVIDQYANY